MILGRPGGGHQTYVIHAISAQITGKEIIYFLLSPLRVALPYLHTFPEADKDTNKNSDFNLEVVLVFVNITMI
jgi:hypothetical protein